MSLRVVARAALEGAAYGEPCLTYDGDGSQGALSERL
jgi:hypothetical protein